MFRQPDLRQLDSEQIRFVKEDWATKDRFIIQSAVKSAFGDLDIYVSSEEPTIHEHLGLCSMVWVAVPTRHSPGIAWLRPQDGSPVAIVKMREPSNVIQCPDAFEDGLRRLISAIAEERLEPFMAEATQICQKVEQFSPRLARCEIEAFWYYRKYRDLIEDQVNGK